MAEATRLCPVCRTIMKSAAYKVGKQDGVERLENNIFTPDGVGIIGKLFSMSEMWEFSSGEINYGESN